MSVRSRKKEIYWGATRRRIPNRILRKLRVGNVTEVWNAIEASVMRMFGGDIAIAWDWFNAPAIALNGLRPLDLVAEGNAELLRDYLIRLEYGVYI